MPMTTVGFETYSTQQIVHSRGDTEYPDAVSRLIGEPDDAPRIAYPSAKG